MVIVMDTENPLSLFNPVIAEWFASKYKEPTEIQKKAWPVIAEGCHILLTAPTGSGKTLTAFLWAIDRLLSGVWESGTTRVLYVSPLRALNNDIRRNLTEPLREIREEFRCRGLNFPEIQVMTRSGDTPQSERRKMGKHPPEILITTPESLNLILTSKNAGMMFSGIRSVILDEIHALAASKRGTHLVTAVERLTLFAGEFQRIAISATVNPLDKIARFAGGWERQNTAAGYAYVPRKVEIRSGKGERQYQITVRFPEAERGQKREDFFRSLVSELREIIKRNKSTLIFVNNRRYAEKITHLINEGEHEQLAYSHHGSLSRELRQVVETRMKRGQLSTIVATNSLELGIDIGSLDMVILIQSPPSVSSALQRIGRAGHEVGGISRAAVYPVHSKDLIESAVMYRSVIAGNIEPLYPLENPLDVLSQIIISMALNEKWTVDELYNFIRGSYPYRNLKRKQFDLVLGMLMGKYAGSRIRELKPRISVDPLNGTIHSREGTAFLLYSSGGTIPDRGYYGMRISSTGDKIGELDEEFVWERKAGESFTMGSQTWKILRIGNRDVEVSPWKQTIHTIPFWRAEQQNRDFHYACLIGDFLENYDSKLESQENRESIMEEFQRNFGMTHRAAESLLDYLTRQRSVTGTALPHRHHLVMEHYFDPDNRSDSKQVILHTFWGGRVNKPFSILLAALWEKRFGYELKVFADNDAVLFMLPHSLSDEDLLEPVLSRELDPANFRELLRENLENTGFFGAHFRENAGRALLLPSRGFRKRNPLWLTRLRSKKLLQSISAYPDFPILLETWRTCLQDQFDLEALSVILEEIASGEIQISETYTKSPSPFCSNIIWRQTNLYMYQDDTPGARGSSSLDEKLLNEAVFSPQWRPRIPAGAAEDFRRKLHRVSPGYTPESREELVAWIDDRLAVPDKEWQELRAAIGNTYDYLDNQAEWIEKRIISISVPETDSHLIITPKTRSLLKKSGLLSGEEGKLSETESDPAELISWWLRYYSPIPENYPAECFGLNEKAWKSILESLIDSGAIVRDKITDNAAAAEICDAENLSRLIRLSRAKRRRNIQPVEASYFPLIAAQLQGIPGAGYRPEHLMEIMAQLFGYPAPAEVWENGILPLRMADYFPDMLDRIIAETELIWYGTGKERIAFCLQTEADIFLPRKETKSPAFIPGNGKYDFFQILESARTKGNSLTSSALTKNLWESAWETQITSDSFTPIRNGIENRFKASSITDQDDTRSLNPKSGRVSLRGYRKWRTERPLTGNWFRLPGNEQEKDEIELEETVKERARQVLLRYGICFRPLCVREGELFSWGRLFPSLRLMELSGEIIGGYYLKGIPGPHFITSKAARIIGEGLDTNRIFWINACDPASPCGLGGNLFPWDLPSRIPSNHLVFHGGDLKVVSKRYGGDLQIFTRPDDVNLPEYLSFFEVFSRFITKKSASIKVETVNGIPTRKSPFREILEEIGFKPDFKAYRLQQF